MPYIIGFSKAVQLNDPSQYINECCIGGDLVLAQLLPALRKRYGDLMSNQEDWGWFVWLEASRAKLAVDVHTEDYAAGDFKVHLTSRTPRFLFGDKIEDTPELEALKDLVMSGLETLGVAKLAVERVDAEYMPI